MRKCCKSNTFYLWDDQLISNGLEVVFVQQETEKVSHWVLVDSGSTRCIIIINSYYYGLKIFYIKLLGFYF